MARQPAIVVTGATGTVGRQVVAQLMDAGAEVRALTRDPESAGLPGGVQVMRGDLSEPDTLRALLAGAEAVYLVWPFATAEGMPAVLDVVAEHTSRMVYLSSAAVRVQEVAAAPARPFRTWVTDHASAFRDTMKAARIHEYGDAGVIRYEQVPRPVPEPDEVLIRVAAASYNPSDAALRSGFLRAVLPVDLPYTLGFDVSGTITETGSDVGSFTVGDRVIGRLDYGGASAEYVAAPADTLVKAPTTIPLTDAAAIPVAALTAWQAVHEHAHLTAKQRVLINGAGGGVGVFAVQLAKHTRATVIATASGRSTAAVGTYGADQIIDYTSTPLADALDGQVDAVINLAAISPDAAAELVALVRPGGVIVSIATPVEPPAGADVTAVHFIARNDVKQLAQIVERVDVGALIVDGTESHPLSDLALVHANSEAGQTHGKITIIP